MAELDLAKLYDRHSQGLFTLALSITGCRAAAEDAVHEAFLRLCTSRRSMTSEIKEPTAYVFTVVRRTAIDHRRLGVRPKNSTNIEATDIIFDRNALPEALAISSEQSAIIADALADLPEDAREVIVLRIYGELSFAQIAEVLEEPLQTVAARYRRSLNRLKDRLEKLV